MHFRTVFLAALTISMISYIIHQSRQTNHLAKDDLATFMEFKRRFGIRYSSKAHFNFRFRIFKDNLAYINDQNNQNPSFELGITQFTDMTFHEFKMKYLFQKPIPNDLKIKNNGAWLIDQIDWRAKGKVSEVKNQLKCGSCWAFSATGALESAYAISHDLNILLSEQELIDCSKSYGNYGCMGGLMAYAFNYIKDRKISLNL